jgi:hypothetical protein
MTQDERLELIEDIKKANHKREEIIRMAEAAQEFDIVAAWETLDELENSIANQIRKARMKD